MKQPGRWSTRALPAFAFMFLCGCGARPHAAARLPAFEKLTDEEREETKVFNDQLSRLTFKAFESEDKVTPSIKSAMEGGPIDRKQAEAGFEEGLKMLREVATDIRKMKVPANDSAKALYKATLVCLDLQEENLIKNFKSALPIALNDKLSAKEKTDRIEELLRQHGRKMRQAQIDLFKAQQKMMMTLRFGPKDS
jgi:hypothetical protein